MVSVPLMYQHPTIPDSRTCSPAPSLGPTDGTPKNVHQAQASGSTRTFVGCDGDHLAGYYSLTVGHVDPVGAPLREQQSLLLLEDARRLMGLLPA